MSLRLDSIISSAVCSLLDPHPLLTPLQPPLWQTHLNPQALPTIPFSAMRTNTVFLLQDLGKSLPINLHVPIRPSSSTPLPQLLGRLGLVLLLDLSPHTRTFFSPSCPCVCQLRHDTCALRPDLHRTLALLSTLLTLPALSHLSPRCCPPRGVPSPVCTLLVWTSHPELSAQRHTTQLPFASHSHSQPCSSGFLGPGNTTMVPHSPPQKVKPKPPPLKSFVRYIHLLTACLVLVLCLQA